MPILAFLFAFVALLPFSAGAQSASEAFGRHAVPSDSLPAAFGSYAKGCLAGGKLLQETTSRWQAMRLSRNRNWGHPEMISFIERLSKQAQKIGWPKLYVGDIGQPRGGPMRSGHRSHQIGLDVDIWLRAPSAKKLSRKDRERISSHIVVAKNGRDLNHHWTVAHHEVIKAAANDPAVARIFVNAAIKRTMCLDEKDQSGKISAPWLRKVRPWKGHNAHFHVRLSCPNGSPQCRDQAPPPPGTGCGAELSKWFPRGQAKRSIAGQNEEAQEFAPAQQSRAVKRALTLDRLPSACQAVLADDDATIEALKYQAQPEEDPFAKLPIFASGTDSAHSAYVGTRYFWRPKVDINVAIQQRVSLKVEGTLPPGLSFEDTGAGNGLITGTPTEAGDFKFDVVATRKGAERGRQSVTLFVIKLNAGSVAKTPSKGNAVGETSLDHQVGAFVTEFSGAECFHAVPALVSAERINVEAFADDVAPFYDFDSAFKSSIGIEANIGGRLISKAQCPAISFARSFPNRGVAFIEVRDADRTVSKSQALEVGIVAPPKRNIALLMIEPDGQVVNVTGGLVRKNGGMSATIRSEKTGPHVLLAIDAGRPVSGEGLAGMTHASQIFPKLGENGSLRASDLRASLSYFMLR